jgi:hypothetical protein
MYQQACAVGFLAPHPLEAERLLRNQIQEIKRHPKSLRTLDRKGQLELLPQRHSSWQASIAEHRALLVPLTVRPVWRFASQTYESKSNYAVSHFTSFKCLQQQQQISLQEIEKLGVWLAHNHLRIDLAASIS